MEVIFETDEAIKRRKKNMGSRNHSLIQENLIVQIAFGYYGMYRAVPELSLDLNGIEKIPDLSIYKKLEIIPEEDETKVSQLPLSVIEILSPKQSLEDLVKKARIYFEAGISSYWLVVPSLRSIYVYYSKDTYEVFTYRDVLKDTILNVELDLSKIFST